MKIISYNVNGIRASSKLGLLDWLDDFDADIYCIQEVRCNFTTTKNILSDSGSQLNFFNQTNLLQKYNATYNCGQVPGYAGTLILSKQKPDDIAYDMGEFWTDNEGRTTTIFINDTAVINTYVPNGTSRLDFKMQYLNALTKYLIKLSKQYKVICTGDFNIAHNEIDLTNPKECKNKSVFLPIERKAFDDLLNIGLIDCYRSIKPQEIKYSWKSYRSRNDNTYNSWQYRIDYFIASKIFEHKIKNCDILNERYSDHSPILLDFE